MTTDPTETAPAQPSEPATGASEQTAKLPQGRAPRRLLVVGGILVALAATVAATTWFAVSGTAADQVLIRWSQESPHCTGTKVRPAGRAHPTRIVAVPGMACTIKVEVLNASTHVVHLDEAVASFVGPRTGTVVRADPGLHPTPATDLRPGSIDSDGIDATMPLGESIEPGGQAAFDLHLIFNPRGCNDSGTLWVDGWPQVTFSVLGRDFTRRAAETYAIQRRGRTPGCRSMDH